VIFIKKKGFKNVQLQWSEGLHHFGFSSPSIGRALRIFLY
jgi:hypothetical protein